MSEENVEIVRRALDAANSRDLDAFTALLSPDVEWAENPDITGLKGLYRGRAEVRTWFKEAFLDVWDSFHVEVEEITELSDDRVLAGLVVTTRGTASGVETELHAWQVLGFAGGLIATRQLFATRDEALEAAGLEE